MGLPRKLKNFAIFVDGENYMGEVPEITPPELARQMEDYRGGGMNMPVKLDFGMEAIELEVKAAGWFGGIISGWGATRHDAMLIRFAGAIQGDDTGEVQAVEIVMRGRVMNFDKGKAEAGSKTEHTYKFALSYYKLTVAGAVWLEVDAVNMIEIVDGNDRLAETRAALGV